MMVDCLLLGVDDVCDGDGKTAGCVDGLTHCWVYAGG